ncbi:PLP-dependent aminotransferase family protein, partial [Enterococcus faecium]
MMAAGPAMEKLILAKQSADSHTNFYWQVVLAEYMDHHDFEGHVAQLTLLYQEKYARMLQALQALPTDKLT